MEKALPDIELVFEKAGGRKAVANALSIKVPSTYSWHRVPIERVPIVSRLTGMPPHELRPDVYQAPEAA